MLMMKWLQSFSLLTIQFILLPYSAGHIREKYYPLEACMHLCKRARSRDYMQFCHCTTMVAANCSLSLIEAPGNISIVTLIVWPADYSMCQDLCTSLEKCHFHYQREECTLDSYNNQASTSSTRSTSEPTELVSQSTVQRTGTNSKIPQTSPEPTDRPSIPNTQSSFASKSKAPGRANHYSSRARYSSIGSLMATGTTRFITSHLSTPTKPQRDVKKCSETCTPPNYSCNEDKCECGFLYSPTSDGKCIPGCTSYSDEFTVHTSEEGTCLTKSRGQYKNIHSWEKCKELCLKEKFKCGFFEIDEGTCSTIDYKISYMEAQYAQNKHGCVHYTRHCNHKGGNCDTCHPPNYRCQNQKCICRLIYSFVRSQGTCVKECFAYADTFTHRSATYCLEESQKQYTNTQLYRCKDLCRTEKQFDCGAFHFYQGTCSMQLWSIKIFAQKWTKLAKCRQYIRDCKPSCEKGFGLIEKKNKCVPKCLKYTRNFVQQTSSVCMSNAKVYNDRSRAECESFCLKSKKPCDGYEIDGRDCLIVYADKTDMGEWEENEGCSHYQRTCQR